MSSMLTWEYLYLTSTDRGLSALTPDVEPENFGVRIPDDYAGKYLDIQKVVVSPGMKMDGDTDPSSVVGHFIRRSTNKRSAR
jgi:hypothetical protein